MVGLYEGIEEIPFKKSDDGYVFKCANPWLIGPRRYFSVNETQKAAISACLRETMRRLRPFIFAAMIAIPAALVGGVLWLVMHGGPLIAGVASKSGGSSTALILCALALMLGLFIPYFAFIHIYSMRRLRPLIADLPRSEERISFKEGTDAFAAKASMKLLIVIAGTCGLGFVMNAVRLIEISMSQHANASIENQLIQTGFSALTAAYGCYLLIRRLKLNRSVH